MHACMHACMHAFFLTLGELARGYSLEEARFRKKYYYFLDPPKIIILLPGMGF